MAHGVVCHFDLPHMAQKVADWTRREGRPRADEMAHGAVCRFELPHVAENNRRVTRVDSSLWPQRTVPKLPSGTNGCQTLKTATLNTSYFCQKRPLCQPPPSPTPPPNSHFVRKVKLRLAYRLAFVIINQHFFTTMHCREVWNLTICWRSGRRNAQVILQKQKTLHHHRVWKGVTFTYIYVCCLKKWSLWCHLMQCSAT